MGLLKSPGKPRGNSKIFDPNKKTNCPQTQRKIHMAVKFLNRNLWQRILGICATSKPQNDKSWQYESGVLTIYLSRTQELTQPGTAVRFEGENLPKRVLVVLSENGEYKAFHNRCTHLGHRRLDYVPGTGTVQCCSINKSTYTFAGEKIHGPNRKPVETFSVEKQGDELSVRLT